MIKSLICNIFKNNGYFFITFIIVCIHFFAIGVGPINLEFTFSDAAIYFNNYDPYLINEFFHYEANTLTLSYIASFFTSPPFLFNPIYTIRLINIASLIALSFSIFKLTQYYGINNNIQILLLVLLNPIVWVFSERATADFSPMALGLFSIYLILNSNKIVNLIIGSFILSLSIILKYHSFIYYIFIIFSLYEKNFFENYKNYLIIFVIPFSIFIIYNIVIFNNFGFWLTPPDFQIKHGFYFKNLFINFISYVGFLFVSSFPFFILDSKFLKFVYRNLFLNVFLFALILFFAYLSPSANGEIDFGPLNSILNVSFRNSLFFIFSFYGILFYFNRVISFPKILLIGSIFLVLILFSLTRPSQRYLILLIPFFILFLPRFAFNKRYLSSLTILLFVCCNLYLECSRWVTYKSSYQMTLKVIDLGFLEVTNPGVIEGHTGNFFDLNNKNYKYLVVAGNAKNSVASVSSNIYFISRTYSLIPIEED